MPAFQRNRLYQIKTVIARLSNRIIGAHRADMTADELFELYTKPKDREILTKVFDLVQLESPTSRIAHVFKVDNGTVMLSIHIDFNKVEKKWLVPKYATSGFQENANPEIVAKLTRWVTKRIALGYECALIGALFDELNWRCNAAGLVFFMPSVLDFLDMIEDDAKALELREKLSTSKVPSLPQLPLGMDEALSGVSATVARARLMDKKSEDRPEGKVRFSLSQPSKGLGETPWGTALTII